MAKLSSSVWVWIVAGIGVLILAATEGDSVIAEGETLISEGADVLSNIISSAYSAAVNAFALAIQSAEGYYPGSWSYTTNNPGNITDMGRPGQVGTKTNPSSGITFPLFDTYQSGFDALCWKINRAMSGLSSEYFPNMTISQFFQKYSGDQNEANNVAQSLGVDPSTTLLQFADSYDGGLQA